MVEYDLDALGKYFLEKFREMNIDLLPLEQMNIQSK